MKKETPGSADGGDCGDGQDNAKVDEGAPAVKNVAAQLAWYLEDWAVAAGKHPESRRGFVSGNYSDVEQWRAHARTVDLARQVDDVVRALGESGYETHYYRKHVPAWYAGAYGVSAPFGTATSQGRGVCAEGSIEVLRMLATRLDELKLVRQITVGERASLARRLIELEGLFDTEFKDLPDDVRVYLRTLIRRARDIVDTLESSGVEAAQRVIAELGGALAAQVVNDSVSNPERAGRLAPFVWSFTGSVFAETGKDAWELGKAAVKLALEQSGLS